MISGNKLIVCQSHPPHSPPLYNNILDLVLEADFSTKRLYTRTHRLHHPHQPKGTDVWLTNVHDFLWGTRLDELCEHLATVMIWIFDLTVQLAVRKCSGPTLTKLDIRLWVNLSLTP